MNDGLAALTSKSIATVQCLISGGDAIVLTTAHQAKFSLEEWRNIFRNRCINIRKNYSLPDKYNSLSSNDGKYEIISWFRVNSMDVDFVINYFDKSLKCTFTPPPDTALLLPANILIAPNATPALTDGKALPQWF
jgi:hypothetical protein